MKNKEGVVIALKIVPKAHRHEILGWENDELKVRLKAVPEKGKANDALLRFLAEKFDIAPSRITLVSGAVSRHKRVRISGPTKWLESFSERFPL
ncbi:MAG: DUF167 domain-containing protein [Parachlamydiaceae bacterium]